LKRNRLLKMVPHQILDSVNAVFEMIPKLKENTQLRIIGRSTQINNHLLCDLDGKQGPKNLHQQIERKINSRSHTAAGVDVSILDKEAIHQHSGLGKFPLKNLRIL